MNPNPSQRTRPAAEPASSPDADARLLEQVLKETVEYTPFQSDEPIKLSPQIVMRLLARPTRSGARCSWEQAMKFVMLCKSRKLNPFEGDAYIVGYDTKDGPEFNLITAHQAFLKRAEVHPEFDGMESGVVVQAEAGIIDRCGQITYRGEALLGGWASVYFKSRAHPCRARLKLEAYHQGRGRWEKDPAGMICKCAEAHALRSAFPTQLGGLYIEGETAGRGPEGGVPAAGRVGGNGSRSERLAEVLASRAAAEPPLPATLDEGQLERLGLAVVEMGYPMADLLARYGVSDLRQIPAAKFAEAWDLVHGAPEEEV